VNTRTPRIQVILGSTREGRAGEQVARWVADLAAQRSDVDIELVDLRDFPLPFFDSPVSPKRALSDDPRVQAWAAKVAEADGYIFVTPEYNYGYPAVLKNALDHLYYQWNDKPVGFVGYGGIAGGIRAVQQLRQVVVELGLVQVRTQVLIPKVFAAFGDDGQPADAMHSKTASALLDEVADWARMLQAKREADASATELASASA
jgi:NAD(P)H-dependent FMN reductase